MKAALPFLLALPLALAAGCTDDAAQTNKPAPHALTGEAEGYYCRMTLIGHAGPKAQMHLAGHPAPLWFAQARDGIAYFKSPEQPADIRVLYVNDMGAAASWSAPGADNWIDARTAYFVAGSDARGGMGAPELVPFAEASEAEDFARRRGGRVMRLADIPAEMVLAPVELDAAGMEDAGGAGDAAGQHGHSMPESGH